MAKGLASHTIEELNKSINKMCMPLQWGGPADEVRFQAQSEPVLTQIINSETVERNLGRYYITSSVNWNRAPLVFLDNNWRDLSQPKVDICFSIASEQSETTEGSLLHGVGKEVDPVRASEIAELLSFPTLAKMLVDPGLASVSSTALPGLCTEAEHS